MKMWEGDSFKGMEIKYKSHPFVLPCLFYRSAYLVDQRAMGSNEIGNAIEMACNFFSGFSFWNILSSKGSHQCSPLFIRIALCIIFFAGLVFLFSFSSYRICSKAVNKQFGTILHFRLLKQLSESSSYFYSSMCIILHEYYQNS